MRVQKCVKGSSVAYPDEQTHAAITKGYCIPSCNLNIGAIKCTFDTRFRDETSIQAADLMTSPFTMITGIDFKHIQTVQTTGTITGTTEGSGTVYASEQTGTTTIIISVIATNEEWLQTPERLAHLLKRLLARQGQPQQLMERSRQKREKQ